MKKTGLEMQSRATELRSWDLWDPGWPSPHPRFQTPPNTRFPFLSVRELARGREDVECSTAKSREAECLR